MTQFTQDTVAIQDAEAHGTRFGYRRLVIPRHVPRCCSAGNAMTTSPSTSAVNQNDQQMCPVVRARK